MPFVKSLYTVSTYVDEGGDDSATELEPMVAANKKDGAVAPSCHRTPCSLDD